MNDESLTDEQIRDYYAGQALVGLMAKDWTIPITVDGIAKDAFDFADAMMKERELRQLPS